VLGSTVPAGRAAGPCGPVPSCGASVGAFLMPPSHLDLDHRRDPCGIPSTWLCPTTRRPGCSPRRYRRPTLCSSAPGAPCG